MELEFDLEIESVKLRVFRQGNYSGRPTLVFLHDSLGCIKLWRDFPVKLGEAAKCNVLIYDRQGYGKSEPFTSIRRKNDYMEIESGILNSLLEQCEITNAILFGHSDGGTIALLAASKYPEKISGIITEGAHIFVEEITVAGIRQAIENYKTTNLKDRLRKYHGEKTEAVFWAWAGTWLTEEYRNWNIEHFLPKIQCPVLIIQGENDEYGSLKQVDRIIKQVSGYSTKLIIPNIGHTPHKEASELTLIKSAEFVSKLLVIM
ncbi:alpha/beta fold hydrolase [Xanthovirga aplysinae]|uniref:alpha/beta fold hydrolase n=1 Tax=Xanthovirga aplysinae TaxID=2529853 RepID=UPI0012BD6D4E|nr:alpha/beta hydrolase [Xanthovirga aplysinae]MTI29642.1 alpha/beta hydrolase [Xanthovirga aplysinae]